jgi:hypothetical protein
MSRVPFAFNPLIHRVDNFFPVMGKSVRLGGELWHYKLARTFFVQEWGVRGQICTNPKVTSARKRCFSKGWVRLEVKTTNQKESA